MSEEQDNQQQTLSQLDTEESRVDNIELQLSSIEIRSDEVQEILGYIPNWIVRWGITLFFAVIIVFMVGSWFFKYPDVIMSTIVITTENPPAAIVSRTSGKIQELFVKDTQQINAGDNVALIETASDFRHVQDLKQKILPFKKTPSPFDIIADIQLNENYRLGELQSSYSVFLKAYRDCRYFISLDFHNKKIKAFQMQFERQKNLHESSIRQSKIMEQEFALSKKQFERSGLLFKDGIISKNDYENAKSTFLQQEYSLEGARSSLSSQKIQLAQLEQSIMELRMDFRERKTQLETSLKQAYDNLSGQIAQWEQTYLLKSPVKGVVTFTKYWSVNQNVKAGDTVITVIPENTGKMIGKVELPIQGSGKVELGQKVNIKLINYPHTDYGMVRGIVRSKSLVATDNKYVLEVDLPDGLFTSYKEELVFTQEMQGSAEIITEDIRLLERILKPIKNIMEKM